MPIPILPIIGAISSLATTTWEIYRKATETRDAKRSRQAQEAIATRVADLEDSALEQLRIINELSERLKDFTEAIQDEMEQHQNRQAKLTKALFAAGGIALLSLAFSIFMLIR